jgi:hypothetical protein
MDLGTEVKLPSGRRVRLTAPFDARRPWSATQVQNAWQVCRALAQPGERGGAFYYGGSPLPLQLNEEDAKALAELLNEVRPGRYPGA